MLRVRDIMNTNPKSVKPGLSLPDLERRFLEEGITGFPVVDAGRLVGIVSRTDIIRQLSVEQSLGEVIADYYRVQQDDPASGIETIADHVGRRMEELSVKEVMIDKLITVAPDESVGDVARLFLERHIHRVPVVEDAELRGIVTTMDLVRLVAEKQFESN